MNTKLGRKQRKFLLKFQKRFCLPTQQVRLFRSGFPFCHTQQSKYLGTSIPDLFRKAAAFLKFDAVFRPPPTHSTTIDRKTIEMEMMHSQPSPEARKNAGNLWRSTFYGVVRSRVLLSL